MFTWIKDLLDNGESEEAVEELRRQRRRSTEVKGDLEGMAERLARSRDAVVAKAKTVQETERASQTDLEPAATDSFAEA